MSGSTTLPPFAPRAYRVEGFIGKGGFGHVYLARNLAEGALGRVALKVLEEGAAEMWVARFFHEAQVLASLSDYPYFVRVNAVFKMERRFCIEMEYIPGVTLDALLERAGALPPPVALHLARQTAAALDAAWSRARDESGELLRVLHRDLKPGNLRVTPGCSVKVLDFGLARSDLRGIRPETLRVLPATLAYMAPERFGFRADFGHAADVYALGLTLYEMLTGEAFFDLGVVNPCLPPDMEALGALTVTRLDALERRLGPSGALRELLERALHLDPAARCTAGELERELRRLGGVGLEDEVHAWAERALLPLIASLPPPASGDPWGWVRTIRRSDAESAGEAAASTLHPTGLEPAGPTLDAMARDSGDAHAASQQKPPDAASQHTEVVYLSETADGGTWHWQAVKLTLAAIGLSVFTWLAVPKPEGAPATPPTAATKAPAPLQAPPEAPVEAPVEPPPTPEPTPAPTPVAPAPTAAPTAAPSAPVPSGLARMEGAEASSVRLVGAATLTLRPGEEQPLPAGPYTATVTFEGGDYPLQVTVREGQTLTFDCSVTRMGSPCSVR